VRHLGPTAQDFHAAFGLGGDDTGIGTVDIAGVTLLAVQALERRTAELGERTREVESLRDEVAVLRAEVEQSRRERAADAERLARLEAVVEQLRSHRTRP
jgi:trimeric autotransporter adhesin